MSKSKNKKAIIILQDIDSKLEDVKSNTIEAWRANLLPYLEEFFGKDSERYTFISARHYRPSSYYASDAYEVFLASKRELHLFMQDCVTATNNLGVKKKTWEYKLIRKKPELGWAILGGLLTFAFFVGHFVGKSERPANNGNNSADNNSEYKSDSIHAIKTNVLTTHDSASQK